MSVRFIDKSAAFVRKNRQQLQGILEHSAKDIMITAQMRVPYKSGKLHKSAVVRKKSNLSFRVLFDKEYAAYQERGMRRDGSHVVKRYTSAGTGKDYLKNAGKIVAAKIIAYIKRGVK